MNTLDHKVGGDISRNLEQLYMFMTEQLTKANITGSAQPLQEVLKILEILNDGWQQAVQKLKEGSENRAVVNGKT
jgi:flagellar protein FliS